MNNKKEPRRANSLGNLPLNLRQTARTRAALSHAATAVQVLRKMPIPTLNWEKKTP
jgi:hypothetical protein